jgi:hypothetical protein
MLSFLKHLLFFAILTSAIRSYGKSTPDPGDKDGGKVSEKEENSYLKDVQLAEEKESYAVPEKGVNSHRFNLSFLSY